ncbi:hypothetical protein J3A83DRAFT_4185914 [Scleroderma citrinum]
MKALSEPGHKIGQDWNGVTESHKGLADKEVRIKMIEAQLDVRGVRTREIRFRPDMISATAKPPLGGRNTHRAETPVPCRGIQFNLRIEATKTDNSIGGHRQGPEGRVNSVNHTCLSGSKRFSGVSCQFPAGVKQHPIWMVDCVQEGLRVQGQITFVTRHKSVSFDLTGTSIDESPKYTVQTMDTLFVPLDKTFWHKIWLQRLARQRIRFTMPRISSDEYKPSPFFLIGMRCKELKKGFKAEMGPLVPSCHGCDFDESLSRFGGSRAKVL